MKRFQALVAALLLLLPSAVWAEENWRDAFTVETKQKLNVDDYGDFGVMKEEETGLYGIRNKDGTWLIEPVFDAIGGFSSGLAPARRLEGGLYGYIDSSGAYVIPPRFEAARPFQEDGLAAVVLNDRFCVINTKGEPVYVADDGYMPNNGYFGGLDAFEFSDGMLWLTKGEASSRLVDRNFNTVLETQDYANVGLFSEGIALVRKQNGLYAAINKSGTELFALDRDVIPGPQSRFLDGKASVQAEAGVYLIDATGKQVSPTINEPWVIDCAPYTTLLPFHEYFLLSTTFGDCPSAIYDAEFNQLYKWEKGLIIPVNGRFTVVTYETTETWMLKDYTPEPAEPEDPVEYQPVGAPHTDTVYAFLTGDDRACVDGKLEYIGGMLYASSELRVFEQDGQVMLPLRYLYWNTDWDGGTLRVQVNADKQAVLHIGSTDVHITEYNAAENRYTERDAVLSIPPVLSEERTFVPLEFFDVVMGKATYTDGKGLAVIADSSEAIGQDAPERFHALFQDKRMEFSDYPIIDGSTATIPLSEALTAKLLGVSAETASSMTQHSKTTTAYNRLLAGYNDLLLTVRPTEEMLQQAADAGVELEIHDLAKEGFVFMANGKNPVDGLTTKQIQDIYQGKIKNWSEVGGADEAILAYQRNENSGSQTIMRDKVMQGLLMMEPTKETTVSAMGAIIDQVAEFDNAENSLGYSVYYYFRNMHNRDEVKLLSVDGVEPNTQNIADESYPFITNYCVILRADEPEGSPTRRVLSFLASDEGRALIEETGFIPAA